MKEDTESNSNQKPVRKSKKWLIALIVVPILIVFTYLIICWNIGAGVRSISKIALRNHPGNQVSALMALVESEQHGYRERNLAIWALGQLGDSRALPLLERLYTGKASDEMVELSQYEIKKAIALCKGGLNISAIMWR
jgi:heme/copper-type cytochrome/quinol oxidase subunit 2